MEVHVLCKSSKQRSGWYGLLLAGFLNKQSGNRLRLYKNKPQTTQPLLRHARGAPFLQNSTIKQEC